MDVENKYGFKEKQETLLKMIKEIDEKFSEKDLFYIFIYGSALGAVRDRGFIPWDDDIDIAVFREDIEKAEEALSELGYYYETAEKHLKPSAPIMHVYETKREQVSSAVDIEKCPEIDIWIIDRVPKNRVKRSVARVIGLAHDFFTYRKAPVTRGKIVYYVFAGIIKLFPAKAMDKLQRLTLHQLIKMGRNENYVTEAYHLKHFRVYEREFLENTVRMPFEDMLVPVPKEYDKYLTIVYGDYMTPPPETPSDDRGKRKIKDRKSTVVTYKTRVPDHHS